MTPNEVRRIAREEIERHAKEWSERALAIFAGLPIVPWEPLPMTADPDEGRRQIEAMKPPRLKVGDRVRLKAGDRLMTVVLVEDYGNRIVCEWQEPATERDWFPAASLVKVEDEGQLQGSGPQGQSDERPEEGHTESDQGPASARS